MSTMHFACGAIYEITNDVERTANGSLAHMMTFVHGSQTVSPPKLNGKTVNCLFACPAKVRDSHRKQLKAWVGDNAEKPTGEPVWCVRCKPVRLA